MAQSLNILISEQSHGFQREKARGLSMDKISFWCFFTAGILPIICAGISKSKKKHDNENPRKWLAIQTGFRSEQIQLSKMLGIIYLVFCLVDPCFNFSSDK